MKRVTVEVDCIKRGCDCRDTATAYSQLLAEVVLARKGWAVHREDVLCPKHYVASLDQEDTTE